MNGRGRDDPPPEWTDATFEGAPLRAMPFGLRSTLREKLERLEDAESLSMRFREQRRKNFPERGDEASAPADAQ